MLGRVAEPLEKSTEAFLKASTSASLDAYDGKYAKRMRRVYASRDDRLKRMYASAEFITDPYWEDWINGLFERIAAANPGLIEDGQRVHIARRSSVNASCYGNRVLSVNMGLIARCTTEEEVAFTLCHELAHQALRHTDRRLSAHFDELYSEQTQQRLREIRDREYGGYDEFQDFLQEFSFDYSRHTRYGESEADSLGLVMYRNAGFGARGPIGLMQVLAKADSSAYDAPLDLAFHFSVPGHPAEQRWLNDPVATSFLVNTEAALKAESADSLRTHPRTDKRMRALKRQLQLEPTRATLGRPVDGDYADRRRAASHELAAGAFDAGRLDLSLYYALRAVEADSSDAWSRGVAALSLAYLAVERANGTFSKVAPPPLSHTEAHFAALCHVLHRMRGRDLRRLSWRYAAAIPKAMLRAESLLARVVAAELDDDLSSEYRAARRAFHTQYRQHAYTEWIR